MDNMKIMSEKLLIIMCERNDINSNKIVIM